MLIFEGLGPTLAPKRWRQYIQEMAQLTDGQLRQIGLFLIFIGWLLFMWVKS